MDWNMKNVNSIHQGSLYILGMFFTCRTRDFLYFSSPDKPDIPCTCEVSSKYLLNCIIKPDTCGEG